MIINAISEAVTQVTALAGNPPYPQIANVCPSAPAGVGPYVNDIIGWIKYGVIAIIIGAGFASIGAMTMGKLASNGRAAQMGASGLFWTIIGAIAFVVIYGLLTGIIGNGC